MNKNKAVGTNYCLVLFLILWRITFYLFLELGQGHFLRVSFSNANCVLYVVAFQLF